MIEVIPFGGSDLLFRIIDGPCTAEITPVGAALRSLTVPGRDGRPVDVCLGYDSPEEYQELDACLGAVVGRYANRISGAAFTLNGAVHRLFANEGRNTLHGGREGFHCRRWDLREAGEDSVVCTLDSPDGDENFPGDLRAEVTYTLTGGTLRITYRAVCTGDTPLNLTNHAYFNLAGAGTVDDHVITVHAGRYTPADGENIPTGELRPVDGTAWDLREPTVLGERLDLPELAPTRGYDQNFVLDGPRAARVSCPRTGITMEVTTDLEGVQLYTAGWLTPRTGKGGAAYGPRSGLCLETQHFPDAVNKPSFPSPILRAGEEFVSVTSFRFGTERDA